MKVGRKQLWWQIPAGSFLLYAISAFAVFDFTSSATPNDEEYFGTPAKPVAFGPEPRSWFCRGADLDVPGGWRFDGSEAVWILYKPICVVWRAATGHTAPSQWR
jgi:hypothetical protein